MPPRGALLLASCAQLLTVAGASLPASPRPDPWGLHEEWRRARTRGGRSLRDEGARRVRRRTDVEGGARSRRDEWQVGSHEGVADHDGSLNKSYKRILSRQA